MCFLSSLTLFIDTFYVVWPICFCIFFLIVMLNVGYYFLLSYSCDLAHELSTCVYVHHCAWLALLERVFNTLKTICHTARPYISSVVFLLWSLRESKHSRLHGGIAGMAVITLTVVITESQPRLVTAWRHPSFSAMCVFLPSIMAPAQHTGVCASQTDTCTRLHPCTPC